MGWMKKVLLCATLAALAASQSGCTILMCCDGDGPLTHDELGDWQGLAPRPAPEAAKMAALIADLKQVQHAGFAGRYSLPGDAASFAFNFFLVSDIPFTPCPGLIVKGRRSPWTRFLPGRYHGDWVYFDPKRMDARTFYASDDGWNALVAWADRAEAYDAATGQRVAARRTEEIIGAGLGWTRICEVMPIDRDEVRGVQAIASPKVDPTQARWVIRDSNTLLLGIFGWGRVNHTRYLQILWIPIPVGRAVPAK